LTIFAALAMDRMPSLFWTFQGMKGQNGFADKDISIILTCLNPEKFAELNVIGQWLGIHDVIDRHYDDQLNQAVGRNRGFHLSDKRSTKTQVITAPGFGSRF
jgi:hypothetical protein